MAARKPTPLVRREDWPLRLQEVIDAAQGVPFGYGPGQQHCCLFGGDAVKAMTGTDAMAWFRDRYTDEKGAYQALRKFAGGGLTEAMDKLAGQFALTEVPPPLAQRGDAVLHDTPDGLALGICIGERFATVTRPDGLAFLPMASALKAWRI
ncbi:MAG: hypothetical protein HYU60_00050 [Magnetospirillum sp.]|nr:hypothetical protein [Magnetospirillum sp.]